MSAEETDRSALKLDLRLVTELSEFALENRMISRADAIRYLLRQTLAQAPKLPKPPFLGARAQTDALGNFEFWTRDL